MSLMDRFFGTKKPEDSIRTADPFGGATSDLRAFVKTNIYGGSDDKTFDRITQYYLNWRYYKGEHYVKYNESFMSFNYVRAFIDRVSSFLLGKEAFSLKVNTYSSDVVPKDVEEGLEKLLTYNWRKNSKAILATNMLQMGSVTGDCWVFLSWDSVKEYVKIKLLDSRYCFPEFEDDDIDSLVAFVYKQPLQNNSQGYIQKIYRYTKEKVTIWKTKSTMDGAEKYEVENINTPEGFKEIPVVHIKNRPQSTDYFGVSDCTDILKLNKVYNEMNQELKGIIDYHATPTTVVTGASTKGLVRGLGQVWGGLPPEANVFTLGLDADLSAIQSYVEMLKKSMHEFSGVPENALGQIQPISNTSGAALLLTYLPLAVATDFKWLVYGEGITRINSLILKIWDVHVSSSKYISKDSYDKNDVYVEPIFKYGFPQDKMVALQEAQMELGLNIASKREIMNRLGKSNIPELMEEISKEREEEAKFTNQQQISLQSAMANIAPTGQTI